MKLIQKRKTLLITLTICAALLLLFSQFAFASDGVKLGASSEAGEVEDEVTVTINIENALDTEGGQFDLSFDSDVVEPVSAARGGFVPDVSGNLFDYNLDLADGQLRVIWVTAEGATAGSGTVGTITFEIVDEGETSLNFSNIVISPDDVDVASPSSGSISSEDPVDELQKAIDDANAAIAALSAVDDLTLADKADVQNARDLVDKAKDLGAEDGDFDDLKKLEDAEKKIAKLEAIKAADDAILALPSVDILTLDDKPDVVAARALVDRAKTEHGAVDDDFTYLDRLRAAENRIKELEGLVPTPPTGMMHYLLPLGMLILLVGLVFYVKRGHPVSR